MKGPWMWVILGVLIAVVIGFLIVSAVLDRRKKKKAKVETDRLEKIKSEAIGNISILINIIVEKNAKKLAKFVPSVGKVKMSDINNLAKSEFEEIQKSEGFKSIKEEDIFMENYYAIAKEKSNNWEKKNKPQMEYFFKLESQLEKETYKEFKKKEKARLTRKYR